MPVESPQWYLRFEKVSHDTRGLGAIAYRDCETSGHVILISLWFWAFIAERCEPMRKGLRL